MFIFSTCHCVSGYFSADHVHNTTTVTYQYHLLYSILIKTAEDNILQFHYGFIQVIYGQEQQTGWGGAAWEEIEFCLWLQKRPCCVLVNRQLRPNQCWMRQ